MAFAVLLAAGESVRYRESCNSGEEPASEGKVAAELWPGMPVWRRSFELLIHHPDVRGVGIVCRSGDESQYEGSGAAFVCAGGDTRARSSLIGIARTPDAEEIVLVHDAARPMITADLISRVVEAARSHGACVPVVPVADTLKRGHAFVEETISRENTYRGQTPQAARRDWLLQALSTRPNVTDEASALEAEGFRVVMVPGLESNEKITTSADLERLKATYTVLVPISGIGYDVHAFSVDPGRKLMLGGVEFVGEPGLEGHSDADPVLHAIVDALLGAVGKGDIGQAFPDSDMQWKDAESRIFLCEAAQRFVEEGASITNVDVTLIAERPRLGANRSKMKEEIARMLSLDTNQVNVKATTHEGLGSLGRGEGIAALAIVTGIKRVHRYKE